MKTHPELLHVARQARRLVLAARGTEGVSPQPQRPGRAGRPIRLQYVPRHRQGDGHRSVTGLQDAHPRRIRQNVGESSDSIL